ncbi:MAG: transcriptional regulator [Acidimicrobiales bacterium]|nr:transcriptional regulator [Acidimicrobiales bacterium]
MSRSTASAPIPTRLLVLGMAHDDGSIHADELYPVAAACGQTPEQLRSYLRRLVADGLFTRHGSGRAARYEATEAGRAHLDTRWSHTRRAYLQDAAGRGWDHRWRLVAYAVPETRRSARDDFRDRLIDLGGAAVHGGLYVSPHAWHDEVRAAAERLGVDRHLTLVTAEDLEVGGARDPRELARRLWPLDEVATRYERFVAEHSGVPARIEQLRTRGERLPDTEFLPLALAIGVAYAECAAIDPYLPPELLPRPWPGRAARELVRKSRRLGLRAREGRERPALFRLFDEMLATIG